MLNKLQQDAYNAVIDSDERIAVLTGKGVFGKTDTAANNNRTLVSIINKQINLLLTLLSPVIILLLIFIKILVFVLYSKLSKTILSL